MTPRYPLAGHRNLLFYLFIWLSFTISNWKTVQLDYDIPARSTESEYEVIDDLPVDFGVEEKEQILQNAQSKGSESSDSRRNDRNGKSTDNRASTTSNSPLDLALPAISGRLTENGNNKSTETHNSSSALQPNTTGYVKPSILGENSTENGFDEIDNTSTTNYHSLNNGSKNYNDTKNETAIDSDKRYNVTGNDDNYAHYENGSISESATTVSSAKNGESNETAKIDKNVTNSTRNDSVNDETNTNIRNNSDTQDEYKSMNDNKTTLRNESTILPVNETYSNETSKKDDEILWNNTNIATENYNATNSWNATNGNTTTDWNTTTWNSTNNVNSSRENSTSDWNSSVENATRNWNSSVENATRNWNASIENSTTNWNSSIENSTTNWNSSIENSTNNWNSSIENSTTNWNSSIENSTTNWNSSIENSTNNWNSSIENSTTNWNSSIENSTNNWNSSIENSTTNWNASIENATRNWNASIDNSTSNWNASIESSTSNWNVSTKNSTGNWNASIENATRNWNASIENSTSNWNTSTENSTTNRNSSVENSITNWNVTERNSSEENKTNWNTTHGNTSNTWNSTNENATNTAYNSNTTHENVSDFSKATNNWNETNTNGTNNGNLTEKNKSSDYINTTISERNSSVSTENYNQSNPVHDKKKEISNETNPKTSINATTNTEKAEENKNNGVINPKFNENSTNTINKTTNNTQVNENKTATPSNYGDNQKNITENDTKSYLEFNNTSNHSSHGQKYQIDQSASTNNTATTKNDSYKEDLTRKKSISTPTSSSHENKNHTLDNSTQEKNKTAQNRLKRERKNGNESNQDMATEKTNKQQANRSQPPQPGSESYETTWKPNLRLSNTEEGVQGPVTPTQKSITTQSNNEKIKKEKLGTQKPEESVLTSPAPEKSTKKSLNDDVTPLKRLIQTTTSGHENTKPDMEAAKKKKRGGRHLLASTSKQMEEVATTAEAEASKAKAVSEAELEKKYGSQNLDKSRSDRNELMKQLQPDLQNLCQTLTETKDRTAVPFDDISLTAILTPFAGQSKNFFEICSLKNNSVKEIENKFAIGSELEEKYKQWDCIEGESKCEGLCLGIVHFISHFVRDILTNKHVKTKQAYRSTVVEVLLFNPKTRKVIPTSHLSQPMEYKLKLYKKDVGPDSELGCSVWENSAWNKSACKTINIQGDVIHCACYSLGYTTAFLIKNDVPTTTSTSEPATLSPEMIQQLSDLNKKSKRSLVNYKFEISADYNATVGNEKKAIEEAFKKQIARQLNLSSESITRVIIAPECDDCDSANDSTVLNFTQKVRNLYPSIPGSIKVIVQVSVSSENNISAEEVHKHLQEKINNKDLILTDKNNNVLEINPNQNVDVEIETLEVEDNSLTTAIILGVVLAVLIFFLILLEIAVHKKLKKGQEKILPFNKKLTPYLTPTYKQFHNENTLDGTIESLVRIRRRSDQMLYGFDEASWKTGKGGGMKSHMIKPANQSWNSTIRRHSQPASLTSIKTANRMVSPPMPGYIDDISV